MSDNNILIVLSAADTWVRADGTEYPTGYWAEEFVVIHQRFVEAGANVDVATPDGQKPTADPHSLDPDGVAGPAAPEHAAYLQSISETLDAPLNLSEVGIEDYDAVVVPGGHGPVVDLYTDPSMGRLLTAADEADGKIIAAARSGGPDRGALFFRPTILTDVPWVMEIAQEEIFGPVLCVLRFSTEHEAVRIANSDGKGSSSRGSSAEDRDVHATAVDVDDAPMHEGGLVADQVHGRVRDGLRRAALAGRRAPHRGLCRLRGALPR